MKKVCLIAILLILLVFLLSVSYDSQRQYNYYANKENYICVTGTVSLVNQSEDNTVLYLSFDNMSSQLSDNAFKVVGNNFKILKENTKGNDLRIGDQLEFMTAPRYFGDGYFMPIVAMKRGETVLLEFEEGVENLLSWLKS